jgi:bifunctional non-homologous end joining protein LigD
MPAAIAPELPVLVRNAPEGTEWLHELKLDGYRMICFVRDGKATLYSRRGNDWTSRFPAIARAVADLGLDSAIVDGEIVALRPDGTSDFQALQNMLRLRDHSHIVFFVFDLLYFRGYDLRKVALIERKHLLAKLLGKERHSREIIRYNDHIAGEGVEVFHRACRHRLEGIVAKRADSAYVEGRTSDWVKVKCLRRQEFVIGGWTEPAGSRQSLGALLVGYYRTPSELVYCGRVGTGFTEQSLRDVGQALRAFEQNQPPFHNPPTGSAARGVIHWAEPELVAEVEFAAWTSDGILRHASFQGLREDKEPGEITLELPTEAPASSSDEHEPAMYRTSPRRKAEPGHGQTSHAPAQRNAADDFAGVRVTHPDRILFPAEKITKRDLAVYYMSVARYILPHIVGRPLSLLRCPDGSAKPCFYQKHLGDTMPDAVRGIVVREKAGDATYIRVDDLQGLISLVQMGALEIHPWGSRIDLLERPDRLIFDIDPAEDLSWGEVVQAARVVKEHLDDLGLTSFVRTTGGKGLHAVVPIARRISWESLKAFAKAFADALVREQPEKFLAQSSKAKRRGKIFLDYLRNEKGATAVASYSTRARPGAIVATPISWDELSASLRPAQFNTRTVPDRLAEMKQDPWQDFFEIQQAITRDMQAQVDRW